MTNHQAVLLPFWLRAAFGILFSCVALVYIGNLIVLIKYPRAVQRHFDRQQARANRGFVR